MPCTAHTISFLRKPTQAVNQSYGETETQFSGLYGKCI